MVRGKIGFGTGWQSANPLGSVYFELKNLNGNALTNGVISICDGYNNSVSSGGQLVCGAGSMGSYWQFDKGMCIKNTLPAVTGFTEGVNLYGYSFRNDAAKTALLAGETLFSVDASMLGCKLEVVVELPIPTSGTLSFEVQTRIERDTEETVYNQGLTIREANNQIEILTPQATADSMRNNSLPGMNNVLIVMAKGLICKNTGLAVPQSDIAITVGSANGGAISNFNNNAAENTFTYTIQRTNIASCGSLYWVIPTPPHPRAIYINTHTRRTSTHTI